MAALRQAFGEMQHDSQVYEIRKQYRNIDSFDKAQKIQAVKDTSLNPFLFNDPFDGLNNSLSRWAQEAPQYAGKTDAEKSKIAESYYDNVLTPLYQHGKMTPLDKNIWMQQAWNQGLKFDPSQAYHSHVVHGLIESLPGVVEPAARAGQTIYNALGLPVAAFADSVKHGDYSGLTGFANLYLNMNNRIASGEGFFKAAAEEGEKAPLLGKVSNFEKHIANFAGFWHDVTPNRSFTEKATSFVAENAMLLPLFGGLSAANEVGIGLVKGAAEGVPLVGNLTEALTATKTGKFAANLLTSGTEGLTWGVLTRREDDKANSWEDALNFAAMGSLFSLIGKHAKAAKGLEGKVEDVKGSTGAGKPGSAIAPYSTGEVLDGEYIYPEDKSTPGRKLHELMPSGEDQTKLLEAEKTALMASRGERAASWEENLQAHRKEMGFNITAGGMTVQHAIFEEALDHVAAWGNYAEDTGIKKVMDDAIAKDPVRYKPVYSSMNLIMKYLKENNLSSDIVRTPLEHDSEYIKLINFLKYQANRAGLEINLNVEPANEMAAAKMAEDTVKTPEGQATLKAMTEQAKVAKVKEPEKAAKKEFLDRRKNFVAKTVESKEVTGTVNTQHNIPNIPPRQRVDSRFEYDPQGNPTAYSMNVQFDWKVAKETLAKAKGKGAAAAKSEQFWQDFVDSTTGQTDDPETANKAFVEDLWKYFNPLKNAGLRFERGSKSGGEISGGDYTNFLGFIYHYRDNLPGPVRDKVEELLMNSPKMYKILGSRPTDLKLDKFGQAIHNHIDMFMRSQWYRDLGQRNVFRSTQPKIGPKAKTQWQLDLVEDIKQRDLKKGKEFYPGRGKAMKDARASYEAAINGLYAQQVAAINKGDEKLLKALMDNVREQMKKAKKG